MHRVTVCRCWSVVRLSLFFVPAIFVSCGAVHHAIQPTAEDIRSLKRIAVVIPNDGEFAVFFDRATATTAPAVLFGLVGAAIASAHNESRDMEKVTALNSHLANFSGRSTFTDAFSQTLKNSGRQTDIQLFEKVPDESQTNNFDAVLTFNIKNWGLRLANRDEARLAPFIELETTLIRARDNQTLWNMHDTFLGQKRSHFAEYKEDGPMLRNEIKETIANAGARMATRIIYPRGNTN
jgi:hypothetical protein